MKQADLLIIGGGPAGVTAAIYAARKGLDFMMISRDIGGQAALSGRIENYTGCQVVSGPELTARFEEHLKKFSIRLVQPETALSLTRDGGRFRVSGEKDAYSASAVIVATGKRSRLLGVKGEKEFLGRGLTYCAVCDGPLFAGRDVAVIGGGNSALDAALQMSRIASRVYVLESSGGFTADKILVNRLSAAGNVEIYKNASVIEVIGGRFVEGIRFSAQGKESILPVRGVFVEIGLAPNSEFAAIASRNGKGEIKVDCSNGTDVPGLFAAGDVTDVPEKQIVIAAGDGAKAALSAARYLLSL
ncbi:MAG: FAD-dependent oxidoreductase [Elusimicrobia bacterium]|nr:FAD-dependent oxidoreductase [Elusimicrobiota bacterium]